MSLINELQERFSDKEFLSFSELAPSHVAVDIKTPLSVASIAMQGAHVLSWVPKDEPPVIWVSEAAKYSPGKSVRGGIPLCWPWFGPHGSESAYPAHGYARTIPWNLINALKLPDNSVRLEFEPVINDAAFALWPHEAAVHYSVTIGRVLQIELTTKNVSQKSFKYGQALHTYFNISDICRIEITGLEDCFYLDRVDNGKRKMQSGAIKFTAETDRVYLDTMGHFKIFDPMMKRSILIDSTGSQSTVVWNPWADKAARMGDFGNQGENRMVCVETANVFDDSIVLEPGESHQISARYRTDHRV